jgi:hypothetical protein
MGQRIQVQTPVLAAAAGVIGSLQDTAAEGRAAARSAHEGTASFGGEPAGAMFSDACAMGVRAIDEIDRTVGALSHNVAMAALGYLNTDEGVIPMSALTKFGGFKP